MDYRTMRQGKLVFLLFLLIFGSFIMSFYIIVNQHASAERTKIPVPTSQVVSNTSENVVFDEEELILVSDDVVPEESTRIDVKEESLRRMKGGNEIVPKIGRKNEQVKGSYNYEDSKTSNNVRQRTLNETPILASGVTQEAIGNDSQSPTEETTISKENNHSLNITREVSSISDKIKNVESTSLVNDIQSNLTLSTTVTKIEQLDSLHSNDFRVVTPGCTIPDLDAWDESIKPFIFKAKPFYCNDGLPALFNSNKTSLFLIKSSLPYYKVAVLELLSCCYRPLRRINPPAGEPDRQVEFDEYCHEFNETVTIETQHEYVKVSCNYTGEEIYMDYFYFIRVKSDVKPREEGDSALNVLFIGIDGVSRLNFLRQMPKTAEKLEELGAVSMYGFNKIDDNSYPNQVPVLTGLTADEIQGTCWPNKSSYFDKCHFIWEDFKAVGFETVFSEDCAYLGVFYLDTMGFINQPTDHYWNVFNIKAESEIGAIRDPIVTQCMGSRLGYQEFLGYTSRFVDAMNTNNRKYFAYLWGSSLTHDLLNKPQIGDAEYAQLLTEFSETGVLNNTALFFMSDHGIRYGNIRATYQGMMEERLPLLYISLPQWYKQKHASLYNNLKTNQRRLIGQLDIHETLKDLLHSQELTDEFINNRDKRAVQRRSYSLFQNITTQRTCEDAGITPHWCTCQSSKPIAANNTYVILSTLHTLKQINDYLKVYPQCATLYLDQIIQARIRQNNENVLSENYIKDYTITFRTYPGGALFETTVRKHVTDAGINFSLTGNVSRINIYGNQSACVHSKTHKIYCYCQN